MLRKRKSRLEYIESLMNQTIISYEENFEELKSKLTMPFSRHYPSMLKFKDYIKKKERPLILDVGCGIGDESIFLNKIGFDVIGIDISRKMINAANTQNTRYGGGVSLILMDVRSLSFKDNLFDGIWCSSFIHHFPIEYLDSILSNFVRILKNNGVLFICVRNFYSITHIARALLHHFNIIYGDPVKFGEFVIGRRYYYCYKPSTLVNKLKKLSFDILLIERLISVGRFHIYARAIKER